MLLLQQPHFPQLLRHQGSGRRWGGFVHTRGRSAPMRWGFVHTRGTSSSRRWGFAHTHSRCRSSHQRSGCRREVACTRCRSSHPGFGCRWGFAHTRGRSSFRTVQQITKLIPGAHEQRGGGGREAPGVAKDSLVCWRGKAALPVTKTAELTLGGLTQSLRALSAATAVVLTQS